MAVARSCERAAAVPGRPERDHKQALPQSLPRAASPILHPPRTRYGADRPMEISFPMTRHGSVIHFGWPLAD